jgi:hypothetical protein
MINERSFSHDVLRGLSNYIDDALKRGIVCCPNCEHWLAMPEKCGLNSLKPPAPIIAFGCERFDPNQVPF